MAGKEALNRKQLIDSILRNKGIISAVAQEMGVTPWTIYNYRDKYSTVADAIEEARYNLDMSLLDGAEVKLSEAVKQGEAWAIRYVLDKKGAKRGYKEVSKQEVEHSGTVSTKAYVGISPDDWDDDTDTDTDSDESG